MRIIPSYLPYRISHIIFIRSSTTDWYLEVRIQARDKQYSSCLLIPETKDIKILRILTSLIHVEHIICTVLGRNIKTRNFWLILILRFEKDWHSIRLDRMQLSFKEHFQLIVFLKLWDWRLEKSYLRNHTCLLDQHQRSHYDTITIGPEEMINWTLLLNNSQSIKLCYSLVEKFNVQRSRNKPNQNQIQSVIDQENLIARKMCLLLKMKRPVPMRSMEKIVTKNSFLQIDQGKKW